MRSKLTLANCQIKSEEKFREVSKAIDVLEKETFIRSGEIEFVDMFCCPDIDLIPFARNGTPTEKLIARICIQLHIQKYRNDSNPEYLEIAKRMKWKSK